MSNQGFSNDSSWKAFKISLKLIWWCIKGLIAVLGFVFVAYKWYRNRKLEKAEEKRRQAEAMAAEAREKAERTDTAMAETRKIVEQEIDQTKEDLMEKVTE